MVRGVEVWTPQLTRYGERVPLIVASRPSGVVASVAATLALAVFFVVMAALSLTAGHGSLSGGVGLALALWAVLVGASAVLLWRRSRWSRGPAVAAGLLHVFAFGQLAFSAPPAALGALLGVVGAVGAALPSTQAWLTRSSKA